MTSATGDMSTSYARQLQYIAWCEAGDLQSIQNMHGRYDVSTYLDSGFYAACTHQHSELATYLVEQGADFKSSNDAALLFAVTNGHAAMVTLLLELHRTHAKHPIKELVGSIFMKTTTTQQRLTEMLLASVISNQLASVIVLTEAGADIHHNEEQALKAAVKAGNMDITKYLLEKGANMLVGKPNAYSLINAQTPKELRAYLDSVKSYQSRLVQDAPLREAVQPYTPFL